MPRLPLAVALIFAGTATAADNPTPEQVKFFESKVRPVLIEHCYKCHAADAEKIRGNLTLDTRDGLRAGGDSGPAVVPGDPKKGTLLKALRSKEEGVAMPPKGPLPDRVIADIETWVKMGAPDPRDGHAATAPKREIDIAKGREFWAFQPPKKTTPPAGSGNWATTDVDRFVQAGWSAKGLKPVADADPYTLARRVYLDLIGLPPTPEETLAFVNDKSPDKYEKLIDTLLASPHFGERWGRHWLDVARYAESTGKAVNFNYPHAWRYRDYVIAAYNADKPFDQFIKEQLAGDLLPAKDAADKAENTIATGFLAIGPRLLNERNRLQYELDTADEQIDAFSQAFLGITAACARCHDHKFDPIPQTDYYALAGIFRSTETCYGTIRAVQGQHPSPLLPLAKEANPPAGTTPLSSTERERLERQLKGFKDELAELTKKSVADSFLTAGGVRNRIQIATLEAKLDLYEKDGTPKALAMGVRERFRTANSPVYGRGEPDKPGKVVPRGMLQVVSTSQPTIKTGSGRKELAEWVASKDNPLTARVYVNRVWQHLFGRGLVPTPDNFGANGIAPANPALLDHLAVWFMDHGWSTKALVKYLMTSHAYRLSSANDTKNYEADPDNTLVWRMSPGRLDAEVIRDQLLAVGANLDRKPPKGSPIAGAGEGYSQARLRPGGPFGGGQREDETHRSVYLPIVRDMVPESLDLFDAADPNLVTGERENTTVPAQALFLMNNPFVLKQAEGFASELAKGTGTDADRIKRAYLTAFTRPATPEEVQSAESFLAKYRGSKSAKWAAFCQAMVSSADFLMRN